jgi:hypothetical protein
MFIELLKKIKNPLLACIAGKKGVKYAK